MSKVRVHELAKEYGLENKEVIARLQTAGITAKTHSSSVEADEARKVLGGAAPKAVQSSGPAVKKKRTGLKIVRKRDKVESDEPEAVEDEVPAVSEESLRARK